MRKPLLHVLRTDSLHVKLPLSGIHAENIFVSKLHRKVDNIKSKLRMTFQHLSTHCQWRALERCTG